MSPTSQGWAIDSDRIAEIWPIIHFSVLDAGNAGSPNTYGDERRDIAAIFGERYRSSGFKLVITKKERERIAGKTVGLAIRLVNSRSLSRIIFSRKVTFVDPAAP